MDRLVLGVVSIVVGGLMVLLVAGSQAATTLMQWMEFLAACMMVFGFYLVAVEWEECVRRGEKMPLPLMGKRPNRTRVRGMTPHQIKMKLRKRKS